MRSLTLLEQDKLDGLVLDSNSIALFESTKTVLEKDCFDATRLVRKCLEEVKYHDFEKQALGEGGKVIRPARLIDEDHHIPSEVALFRTNRGDRRIRITGLNGLMKPKDIGILFVLKSELVALNLSRLSYAQLKKNIPSAITRSVQASFGPLPDLDMVVTEGDERLRKHLVRERNAQIVMRKKKAFQKEHGCLFCEACTFDFAERYGEYGEGFIECHHIVPLASFKVAGPTRLKDLAMLCSNCHRMVHRRANPLTLIELGRVIQKNRKSAI